MMLDVASVEPKYDVPATWTLEFGLILRLDVRRKSLVNDADVAVESVCVDKALMNEGFTL